MRSEGGGASTPLFAGADPLAALTENLNQHITSEAFKPRAAAPWELNTFDPPSTIPEEETFGFADREASGSRRVSREVSQQIPGGFCNLCTKSYPDLLGFTRL
jgi:hypothetical protein